MSRTFPVVPWAAFLLLVTALSSTRADELDPAPPEPAVGDVFEAGAESVLQPLQRTILATHPVLRYRLLRTGGVLSSPGDEQTTTVQTASVALRWNLGDYLMARYTPTWTYYSNDAFQDNLSHEAMITVERGFVDWNFLGTYRYLHTSAPLIETGRQTTQDTQSASLQAQRSIGYRTTLELGLRADTRSAEQFAGYHQWSTDNWLHYQLSGSVSTSAGLGYGYVTADGPSMSYEQVRGRVRWQVSEKISVDARAGVQTRSVEETERGRINTPVYGATLSYVPFSTTRLVVTGDRTLVPSYFESEMDRIDTWQAAISQRLVGRFHADLAYVRRLASHRSSVLENTPSRSDTGQTVRARLGTNYRSNGSIAIFYQTKRNRSNDPMFDFDGSQVGLETTLVF